MRRALPLFKRPSGSTVGKLVNCTASHVLPQNEQITRQGEAGTDKHEPWAALINKRPTTASQEAKDNVTHENVKLILDGAGMLEAETAYVLNVKTRTVIALGKEIGREYEKALGRELEDYEIPLSLDLEGMKDGSPWDRDLKFGIYSDEWQLRIHAMALSAKYDHQCFEIDTGFVFIDPATAKPRIELHPYTIADIEPWWDVVASAWDKAKALAADGTRDEASLWTREGPWCSYCGALPSCSAKASLVRAMGEHLGIESKLAEMTLEERGRIWARTREYEKLLERITDTLKELTLTKPTPLPNGKLLTMKQIAGYEYPAKHETLALLKELGATEEQIRGVMKRKADHYRAIEVNQ